MHLEIVVAKLPQICFHGVAVQSAQLMHVGDEHIVGVSDAAVVKANTGHRAVSAPVEDCRYEKHCVVRQFVV